VNDTVSTKHVTGAWRIAHFGPTTDTCCSRISITCKGGYKAQRLQVDFSV
jgi:hypothetical protein